MNFSEFSKGGGGVVIFDLKKFIASFFALKTAVLVMIFWKNFKRVVVISDLKNFIANLVRLGPVCGKNCNIFSEKGAGGGVKGRSEIFRKFICFLERRLPL